MGPRGHQIWACFFSSRLATLPKGNKTYLDLTIETPFAGHSVVNSWDLSSVDEWAHFALGSSSTATPSVNGNTDADAGRLARWDGKSNLCVEFVFEYDKSPTHPSGGAWMKLPPKQASAASSSRSSSSQLGGSRRSTDGEHGEAKSGGKEGRKEGRSFFALGTTGEPPFFEGLVSGLRDDVLHMRLSLNETAPPPTEAPTCEDSISVLTQMDLHWRISVEWGDIAVFRVTYYSQSEYKSNDKGDRYRSNGGDGSGGSGGTSALTVEEKAELKANFDAIDTDKGGTLDRYEFKAAMELAFAKHPDKPTMPSDDVLKQEFNRCDTDKNGTIDLDEFLEVFAKVKRGEDGGILGKMLGRSVSIYLDTAAAVHESNELRKSKARTKQAGGGAPTLADFRQETRGDGFVDYYLVVRNLAADQVRGVRDKGKEGEGKASTRLIGDI